MNLILLLQEQVRLHPDSVAIIEQRGGRTTQTTYRQLDVAAAEMAGRLQADGVRPGDGVLVFHTMGTDLYVVILALFRLGAVALFLDPSAGRRHIDLCCSMWPPQALIASRKAHWLRLISPALRRIPRKYVLGGYFPFARRLDTWSAGISFEGVVGREDGDPALVTFTSGSTGQPKATVRTHGFLRHQHQVLVETMSLQPGQVDLTTLPIFLLANLASGMTSLIPDCDLRRPGFIDPHPVLEQIGRYGPASVVASPAFLERLAEQALAAGRPMTSFRKVFTGGAPVFPSCIALLKEAAPNAEVVAVYGSTEAEPIAEVSHRDITEEDLRAMSGGRGLLAGRPVDAIHLRIIRHGWGKPIETLSRQEFDAITLPAEEPGEIVVQGDHVIPGYLNGQGDKETKFEVEGLRWHRTGDSGSLDRLGRLWLLGRCAARIADSRGILHPFAVEVAVQSDPGVRRAALIENEGRRWMIVQMKRPGDTMDPDPLASDLSWAGIDEVRVVKEIPVDKRHNAKIDYPALKRLLKT